MQIRCPHCQNGIELVDDSDNQMVANHPMEEK